MEKFFRLQMVAIFLVAVDVRGAVPVTKISSGCEADQSYFLTADGRAWGMGVNGFSQNGLDLPVDEFTYNRPEQILLTNVAAMAGGNLFSYVLLADGTVWGSGAPGTPEVTNFDLGPVAPLAINEVIALSAGYSHGLFLRADGSLWGVGNSFSGQIGDGKTYSGVPDGPSIPEQIVSDNVKAIAAGGDHSLFLKTDGSLWGMGSQNYGQLGDGRPGFVQYGVAGEFLFTNLPEQIVRDNVVAIAAGGDHSLFLKADGSLWGMGYNRYGQLGIGNFTSTNVPMLIMASNVVAIAAGEDHSLFLMSDGSMWGMGSDGQGQLGSWPNIPLASGIDVPEMLVPSNVVAIAAGQYHSLYLKSDGSLWAVGQNTQGQLGDGFTQSDNEFEGTDTPEEVYPAPQPLLEQMISGGADLQFTVDAGFGGTFYLLSSTNVTLPVNQWTSVWTNEVDYRYQSQFSIALSNVISTGGPQQFFRLRAE